MKLITCPNCSKPIARGQLSSHPLSEPMASRALSRKFCPHCGVELVFPEPRVRLAFIVLFALLLATIWLKPYVVPTFLPSSVYVIVQAILFVANIYVAVGQRVAVVVRDGAK